MKTGQVSKFLGIGASTIRLWVKRGILKCQWSGKHRIFDEDDIKSDAIKKRALITRARKLNSIQRAEMLGQLRLF